MCERERGYRCGSSSAESTLKVGAYFNIFPNFLAISESGGITKSRPIDSFLDAIYLFLDVRFGQKGVQIGPFLDAMIYACHFLPPTQAFFPHFPKIFPGPLFYMLMFSFYDA